jgi:DNA-binding beta-propeller fold protein YncE
VCDVRRSLLRRLLATTLVGTTLLAGCTAPGTSSDELQVSDTVTAAGPAISPTTSQPAGTVLPPRGNITAVAVDPRTRTLAVAGEQPTIWLYQLDNLAADPRALALPGNTTAMTVTSTGLTVSLGPAQQIAEVSLPDARVTSLPVTGVAAGATQDGDQTLVALSDRKAIDVVRGGRQERQISGGLFSADAVVTVGRHAVVLDRQRTAVFDVDVPAGKIGAGQRAGRGATNAVVDRFGRVLVTDTRGGALLAFTVNPVLLRQNYPVPGAPYGIAYDPKRDLAWVTLTERNEVVGYNVAGGEPVEKFRFATVVQPNSVTVDPDSGRVFVASATGGGVQVMQP